MVAPGTLLDFSDHTVEVLASPAETGDRYRVRVVAEPGGGPGIKGAGPHVHPGIVEIFDCVSGTMTVRAGSGTKTVAAGERLEVPPGTVHGFVNSGDEPLVVDTDLVFTPPGPRPRADLMRFAAAYAGLVRDGRVSRLTGEPRLLQMAVLLREYREGIAQPGLLGLVMRGAAPLGRLRGCGTGFPEYGA